MNQVSTEAIVKRPGFNLSYCVRGGGGEPVVMIQGVGVAGSGWEPQVTVLARDHRCLTFDNRGIGRSVPLDGSITIEEMAEDVRALMDHLGWPSAHVVGHSMGGIVAQDFALKFRERVKSLALLCTFSRGKEGARLTPWVLWMTLRTRLGPRSWRRRAFLEMLFPKDYVRNSDLDKACEEMERLVGRDLAVSPPVMLHQLKAMARYDASLDLHKLSGIPTLVLSGGNDPIARPVFGHRLAQLIPGSRYEELKAAAHGLPIQLAEEVNSRLRRHFQLACG